MAGTRRWLGGSLRAGLVAAGATAGVLVRWSMVAGEGPLGAFAAVGRLAAGVTAVDGPWAQRGATLLGLLVHVAVVEGWAVLLGALVAARRQRPRGARLWLAAAGVGALAWIAGAAVLPPVLRLGHGAQALAPQLVLLHAVLSLGLAVGMRLAFPEEYHER